MYNVLEEVTKDRYPVIGEIEATMMDNKALGSMMSGSGPTVFGLFNEIEDANKCKNRLSQKQQQVYVVKSYDRGVELDG